MQVNFYFIFILTLFNFYFAYLQVAVASGGRRGRGGGRRGGKRPQYYRTPILDGLHDRYCVHCGRVLVGAALKKTGKFSVFLYFFIQILILCLIFYLQNIAPIAIGPNPLPHINRLPLLPGFSHAPAAGVCDSTPVSFFPYF